MEINTKYNIGDHVWFVDQNFSSNSLDIFDDYIFKIDIDKDGVCYLIDEENYIDVEEDDIILYEDKDKLYDIIKLKMKEMKGDA